MHLYLLFQSLQIVVIGDRLEANQIVHVRGKKQSMGISMQWTNLILNAVWIFQAKSHEKKTCFSKWPTKKRLQNGCFELHFKAETIGFPTANGLKHLVTLFTRNIRTCQLNILIGR